MHLAVVASSIYSENESIADLPTSEANEYLLGERLGRPDVGFQVETMEADDELPSLLHERLSFFKEPLQSLLFYFSGYAVTKPVPGPALLLDGEKLGGIPLERLFRTLESASHNTLVVLDVATVMAPGQTAEALTEAIVDAMPTTGRLGTLVATRPAGSDPASGPSPLTDLFILSLDYLVWRVRPADITAQSVYEAMQAERAAFSRVGAARFRTGLVEFAMCPGSAGDAPPTPPAGDSARLPAPSWAPRSIVPPDGALPSFDDAVGPGQSGSGRAALASSLPPTAMGAPSEPSLPSPPRPAEIPTMASIAAGAKRLVEEGHVDEALDEYDRALLFCDPDDHEVRASLLVDVGVALRTAERLTAALEKLYDALEIDPTNARAIAHACDLLRGSRHYESIEHVMRLPFECGATDDERAATLYELAAMWLEEAGDRENGVRVLQELLALRPEHARALALLVRASEGMTPDGRVDITCRLAEVTVDAREREERFAEAAKTCIDELDDLELATSVAKRACKRDPRMQLAFKLVVDALAGRERWVDLAIFYEQVVEHMPEGPESAALLTRLGELYRDRIGHEHRGLQAFERALSIDGRNTRLRLELAALYESRGLTKKAIEHLQGAVRATPGEPDAYRRILGAFERVGETDGVWNAASSLVVLGYADSGEAELVEAGKNEGLLEVERALDEDDWKALLHASPDDELTKLFGVIADAAIAERIKTRAKEKDALVPDEALKQDLETSTATMIRSLVWTAKLLDVPPPELYLYPKVKRGILTLPVEKPTTLASKELGSGLTLEQLCFLWGRHLSFFRAEHQVLIYYSTTREIASLVLAALTLGRSEKPDTSSLDKGGRQLAKVLAKALGPEGRGRLRSVVAEFPKHRSSDRVLEWVRAVELTAARVGLLACGDAAIAVDLVRRHPVGGLVTEAEQIDDVLSFSVSDAYLALRERLGASSSLIRVTG